MLPILGGSTTQKVVFSAPSAGLTGFEAWYSKNGASAVQYTTPSFAGITNMSGRYALTVDEGTGLDTNFDTESYSLRIIHAALPNGYIDVECVLYRNNVTHVAGGGPLEVGGDDPASPVGVP